VGIYVTVAELRAEPEVPDAAPPSDATLEALIEQAEDRIDELLGPWSIQTSGASEGRKIAEVDVETWQWSKLRRATVRLAARLYDDPSSAQGPAYASISGPDFSQSGWRGLRAQLPDVVAPLESSGLRVTGARAV
jgi:hypothetical protein